MAFVRKKAIKGNEYYYLVESYKDKKTGKIRQRVIKYLGNKSKLNKFIKSKI